MTIKTIDELKSEATDLGIDFNENITAKTLQTRIDAFYDAKSKAGIAEADAFAAQSNEQAALTVSERKLVSKQNFRVYAAEQAAAARKTRIVTIIDNDQRTNNHATTCIVNCSNLHLDLGTAVLPLGVPVEVRQGHINVLSEVRIPRHTKDLNDPTVSVVQMVPRYTIQYEQIKA